MEESRRAEDEMDKMPTMARVIIRVMFREGPVVVAFLVMLAVILGIIPSPYLGQPLETIIQSHKEQLAVLEDIRDDLKAWHQEEGNKRRR